jgi:hypothetical protein
MPELPSPAKPRRNRLAPIPVLVPLLVLALSWVMLAVPFTATYLYLKRFDTGAARIAVTMPHGDVLSFPRKQLVSIAFHFSGGNTTEAISAINFPGFLGEALLSLAVFSKHGSWSPPGILYEDWRALAFPVFALPVWWFWSRALESLVRSTRRLWRELIGGTLVAILFLVLALGLRFGMTAAERAEGYLAWVNWGSLLWAILMMIFPAALVRQTLLSRRA